MLGAFKCSTVIDNSGPGVRLVPKVPIVTPQQAFAFASEHEAESKRQAEICQKCEAVVKRAVDRAQDATTLAQKQAALAPVLEQAKQAIEAAAQSVAHGVAAQKADRADVTSQTVKVNLAGMVPNSIAAGKVFGLPVAGKGYLDAIKRDVRLAYQMPSVNAGGGYQYQWNQKQSGTTGAMSTTMIEQRQVFGSMLSGMDYSSPQGMGRRSVRGLGEAYTKTDDPFADAKEIVNTASQAADLIKSAGAIFASLGDAFKDAGCIPFPSACGHLNCDLLCSASELASYITTEYPAVHGAMPTEGAVLHIAKTAAEGAKARGRTIFKPTVRLIIQQTPPPPKGSLPPITSTPPPGTDGGNVTAGAGNMLAFAIGGAGILAFILSRK